MRSLLTATESYRTGFCPLVAKVEEIYIKKKKKKKKDKKPHKKNTPPFSSTAAITGGKESDVFNFIKGIKIPFQG